MTRARFRRATARGGLYLWRVRKPHAVLGLPFIGRHFGYGGMTNSYSCRELEHLTGRSPRLRPAQYKLPASWSDLEPKCYRVLPLPDSWTEGSEPTLGRQVTKALETVLIGLACPVYNDKQQPPWNVRKISRARAARMRAERDAVGRKWSAGARLVVRCLIYALVAWIVIMMWQKGWIG
jgi:hypothetical protein